MSAAPLDDFRDDSAAQKSSVHADHPLSELPSLEALMAIVQLGETQVTPRVEIDAQLSSPAPASQGKSASVAPPVSQADSTSPMGATDFVVNFATAEDRLPFDSRGRYQLDEEIARGGVGIIYKGRDHFLGREIAFKVLLATHQKKAELRRRFDTEARITGRLEHPGIVPIYDLGQLHDKRPFFTMRLVKGNTLAQLLADRSSPVQELPRFLKIFEQICQTMAYAHSKGVIHRDLKPANAMVAEFGVVTVMDWGVAKLLAEKEPGDAAMLAWFPAALEAPDGSASCNGGNANTKSNTEFGSVMGTLAYMPPEQARGQIDRLDERADVFGLGAILCEILIGRPPYVGPDSMAVYEKAVNAELDEALVLLDGCRAERELVAVAKCCLAARPEDRPRHAGDLVHELTAYLESDLRRAERDLVRFFELSMDLFCIASLDGYFRRVNSNFSRILGHPEKELLARPFLDFVHVDDHARTMAEMDKLSQGLPVVQFRNRYRDCRGAYRWFEWTAKSIPKEDVIFAVARDVTERVQHGPVDDGLPSV